MPALDATLTRIGKNEPGFFYPGVPDEALEDQDRLVTSYRRTLGRERIWQLALGGTLLVALYRYVRGQAAGSRKKR